MVWSCAAELGLTIWSPLGGGALTGKYKRGQDAPEDTRYGRVLKNASNPNAPPSMKAVFKMQLTMYERSLDVAEKVAPIAKELG